MPDFNWTDEAVAELKALWADGLSAAQCVPEIEKKFGTAPTRNAVIGKIHRLGLSEGSNSARKSRSLTAKKPKQKPQREAKQPRKTVTRQRIIRAGRGSTLSFVETVAIAEPLRELSADEIPLRQRKQLLELKHGDCRWPYGDPGKPDFFFCGAVSVPDRPYCGFHCRVARGTQINTPVRPYWRESRRA